MFLPDRYIKGECPKCGAKDQYGDTCEVCGAVYAPTDLMNPYSTLTRRHAGAEKSASTSSSSCPTRAASTSCRTGRTSTAGCSPRCSTRSRSGSRADERRHTAAWATGTSRRDAPYFGIEIPDAPGKYFYVWLDAPVGYLASLKNLLRQGAGDATSTPSSPTRPSSSSTSSARTSSTSTRCSGRRCCSSAAARCPNKVFVHGFITVSGEKMSKSRGTGIDPLRTSSSA